MNQFYPSFTWASVGGKKSFPRIQLVCALMPSSFEFNPAHKSLVDVSGDIVSSVLLKHALRGDVLDAKDAVFTGFDKKMKIGSLLLYAAFDTPEVSPLLAFLDRVSGFPTTVIPGGQVFVAWDNNPLRIACMDEIK